MTDIKTKEESLAQLLFDNIGTGSNRAMKRPKNPAVDRHFRRLIEEANNSGDCIINVGTGYFRPEKEDEPDLDHYLNAELQRADKITDKVYAMKESYYGRY